MNQQNTITIKQRYKKSSKKKKNQQIYSKIITRLVCKVAKGNNTILHHKSIITCIQDTVYMY